MSALGLLREPAIRGKLTGDLPRSGELDTDAIKRCFGLPVGSSLQLAGLADVLVGRPPSLCDKCPHTDAYIAINEVLAEYGAGVRVLGDIGCYTLGAIKPYQAIHATLCMGASIGMAIGAAHAGMTPSLCVIGDGTFTHSGMTPLLDAAREHIRVVVPSVHKKNETMTIIREELPYQGLSVVIARRACVTYAKQIKAQKRAGQEGEEE